MDKMTTVKRAALFALLIGALSVFTGCGKTEVFKGGTDYPYEIQQKGNGKLVVMLDGSKTPEYRWDCVLESVSYTRAADEEGNPGDPLVQQPPVTMKQKGKEKNGKAKFVFKPALESTNYTLTFTRHNPEKEKDAQAEATPSGSAGSAISEGGPEDIQTAEAADSTGTEDTTENTEGA